MENRRKNRIKKKQCLKIVIPNRFFISHHIVRLKKQFQLIQSKVIILPQPAAPNIKPN